MTSKQAEVMRLYRQGLSTCEIARRLGGHHRMMHLPDLLDEQALNEMRKLKEIDETLALLRDIGFTAVTVLEDGMFVEKPL